MPTLSPAGTQALALLRGLALKREDELLSHDGFVARALPVIAAGIGCERVSLWMDAAPPGATRTLHCRGLFVSDASAADLPPLVEAEHPAYFGELDRHGILRAPDAPNHPALASLRDAYLRPNDIRSLLDVPFSANGRRLGLLCAEQTGRRLDWQPAHVAFMQQAGITGSLLFHRLAEGERRRLGA